MAHTPNSEVADCTQQLFKHAIQAIDDAFGAGYAMKNPSLIGQFMLAAATTKAVAPAIPEKQ
jgi:hypothetical protein